MSSRHLLFGIGALSLLQGCGSPRYAAPVVLQSDYVHLYSKGGWGLDSDIWIYPNDRFTVAHFATNTHRVDEQYSGSNPGLFRSIVRRVQQRSAWGLSTASLQKDLEVAQQRSGAAHGVMDSSHYNLEIRYGAHRLQADCYAPQAFSEIFPEVRSLRNFAQLTKAVLTGTTKVEQGNRPGSALEPTSSTGGSALSR